MSIAGLTIKPRPTSPGFTVVGSCGRTWFVPLQRVKHDYAQTIEQLDECNSAVAMQKVNKMPDAQLETWFREQFNWSDVVRLGVLIGLPTEKQLLAALDSALFNAGTSPGHDFTFIKR